MNLPKLLTGLLLVAIVSPAVAVGPSYLGNLTDQSFGISNSYNLGNPLLGVGNTFSDSYIFDIGPASLVVGTSITVGLSTRFEMSNMKIEFVDSNNNILAWDSQTLHPQNDLEIYAELPVASNYRFIVSGTVTGSKGGGYGGVLEAIPVAYPVPESETYAFLALGIGLVGVLARRRRV
jgi:hypothetical protein